MRVLHLSKYDGRGGAARAAAASVMGQRAIGIDAILHAGRVERDGVAANQPGPLARMATLARYAVERLPFRVLGGSSHDVCSIGIAGERPETLERRYRPDIIMLHNIDGLIAIDDLPRFSVPVIWRLHDMWALRGTHHYQPERAQPDSIAVAALDRWTWQRKAKAYPAVPSFHLVPPSQWLAMEAASSPLTAAIPCTVVPNGIDIERFRPTDRSAARAKLGIVGDGPVLSFGAASGSKDPRKGFDLLLAALGEADAALHAAGATLLMFGGGEAPGIERLRTTVRALGHIASHEQLVEIYNAADLFIAPSRQENLSLMVLESLACGTPVMAFAIGGMPDMIRPGTSGWLVSPFDIREMAELLRQAAATTCFASGMRVSARSLTVRHFSTNVEARQMSALFRTIMLKERGTDIDLSGA